MANFFCLQVPAQYAKWMALAGGVLMHLAFGTLYTFGNLSPYVTSYLRAYHDDTSVRYSSSAWIFALATVCQGAAMPLSGVLERRVGGRATCALGSALFSAGVLLTSFSLRLSFYAVLFTYGVMFGAGIGLAYPVSISCAVRWFPRSRGTVSGVIVCGFGLAPLLFNLVQTLLINPDNQPPDASDAAAPGERYFSQPDVLQSVPRCFLLLALMYASLQLAGVALLMPAPAPAPTPAGEQTLLLAEDGRESAEADPAAVLRSAHFYVLYAYFFCNQMTVNFMGALYKAFGLTFIGDDLFLALVGSLSSVFNAIGRVAWGALADCASARLSLFVLACCNAALLFAIYSCSVLPRVAYLLFVCFVYFVLSGVFAICPAAMAKLFGTRNLSTNYGMLFTAAVPAGLISATLTSSLLDLVGWFPMFCLCASFYVVAACLAHFFRATTADGREV